MFAVMLKGPSVTLPGRRVVVEDAADASPPCSSRVSLRCSPACRSALAGQLLLRLPEVAGVLEVQPEQRARLERLGQKQGGLGRHGPTSLDDAVDHLDVQ